MIDSNSPPVYQDAPIGDNARLSPKNDEPLTRDELPFKGKWTDQEALSIVKADFQRAESYRSSNHESRWMEADATYLAYSNRQNVWEGTKIPRSNMQIYTAYENVEALIPQILDALYGGDLDFDVQPGNAFTTEAMALGVRDLLNYQLKSLGGSKVDFVTLRENTRRSTKSAFIYGNGIAEWGWEGPYHTTRKFWTRNDVAETMPVEHPQVPGLIYHVPTGRTVSMVSEHEQVDTVSQFFLKYIDIRDFYIDPNCPSGNVQEAGFCAHRKLMTLEEVASYRDKDGWNVPDDKTLLQFAKDKQISQGDIGKSEMESNRGIDWTPNQDYSKDPRLARLEIIRYWQKGKHVWMINRRHIMWNGDNQYKALPFLNQTYTDVLGRFYGLSICDVVRGDQKLIKTLVDGRLDELNLILHPPTLTKRGAMRSTSMMRLSPGRNWEVDDPAKDVLRLEMGNVTQGAFTEVDSAERRVQKKTGVTDLAVLGVSSSGGNSANRTATGVSAQTNASNSRVHYLVANFEDQVMLPILTICLALTKNFLSPDEMVRIIGPAGQALQLDPVDILNADVRFEMKTAQRMKARASLQGGGLNIILQYFLNPETGKLMAEQQGKVIDIESVSQLTCDTFNLRASTFFRPMTPQEQQALQQQQNGPLQEKMQLQTARISSMSQDAHERDETTIAVAILDALVKSGKFNEIVGLPTEAAMKLKELEAKIEGGQFEAAPNAA